MLEGRPKSGGSAALHCTAERIQLHQLARATAPGAFIDSQIKLVHTACCA